MSKTVYFDVSKETIGSAAEGLINSHGNNGDSILVLAPFVGKISTYAPAKKGPYRGYHRLKLEIFLPEDAIKGEDALRDFGAFAVMRLPKERVQDHLVQDPKQEN